MDQIGLYLTLAAIAGIVLYTQINKLTRRLDEDEAMSAPRKQNAPAQSRNFERAPSNPRKYEHFSAAIEEEMERVKQDAISFDALKPDAKQEKFLEDLANISKKLAFVKTMNTNVGDDQKWESELVGILARIEELIERDFKDAASTIDRMQLNLEHAFKQLR